VYAISVLILLFNCFAYMHSFWIRNDKALCIWNAKKHELACWLFICLVNMWLRVRTWLVLNNYFYVGLIFAMLEEGSKNDELKTTI